MNIIFKSYFKYYLFKRIFLSEKLILCIVIQERFSG